MLQYIIIGFIKSLNANNALFNIPKDDINWNVSQNDDGNYQFYLVLPSKYSSSILMFKGKLIN